MYLGNNLLKNQNYKNLNSYEQEKNKQKQNLPILKYHSTQMMYKITAISV